MQLEFDEAKSARNVKTRGIGFERFADMDLPRALSLRRANRREERTYAKESQST